MSSYKTVEGTAQAEITEKKSRFIAHVSHVASEEEALDFLGKIRAEHAQARHNVYAYILHTGRTRYSDDGEPAQTSGLPTFETLQHAGLEDVICVTTRYFGGILLGTGGLVRAYTQAAQAAIACAQVVTVSTCVDMLLETDYSNYQLIERFIQDEHLRVNSTDFTDTVSVSIRVLAGCEDAVSERISQLTRGTCKIDVGDPIDGIL